MMTMTRQQSHRFLWWLAAGFLALMLSGGTIIGSSSVASAAPSGPTRAALQAKPAQAICEGITAYVTRFAELQQEFSDRVKGIDFNDVANWTTEQYDTVVGAITDFGTSLTGITPPAIAVELHKLLISANGVLATSVLAVQTLGPIAATVLAAALTALATQTKQLNDLIASACGITLDGTPVAATPVAAGTPAAVGTPTG